MPTCKYFIAKTFAHIAGGLTITAVSAQYPVLLDALVSNLGGFGVLILVILQFVCYFVLVAVPPNTIYKYIAAFVFVYIIGQITGPMVKALEKDNLLIRVLALTTGVFLGMMAIGFYDSQNMLKYQFYVIGALIGLIIIEIILNVLIYTGSVTTNTPMRVLTFIGVGIFALLTGTDIQVLKEHAKACTNSPDYVNESISLFLDYINLFQKIGFITESD